MKTILTRAEMENMVNMMASVAGDDSDELEELLSVMAMQIVENDNGEFESNTPEAFTVPMIKMYSEVLAKLMPLLEPLADALYDEQGFLMDLARVYFKRVTGIDLKTLLDEVKEICLPYLAEMEEALEDISGEDEVDEEEEKFWRFLEDLQKGEIIVTEEQINSLFEKLFGEVDDDLLVPADIDEFDITEEIQTSFCGEQYIHGTKIA